MALSDELNRTLIRIEKELLDLARTVRQLQRPANPGFVVGAELTITTGVITLTGDNRFRHHTVDTEADAATDDLTTINGGNIGDLLLIRPANTARTVVVKDGLEIATAGDFTMDSSQDTMLLVRTSASLWQEVTRSDNGA